MNAAVTDSSCNLLLASLGEGALMQLLSQGRRVMLGAGDTLYETDDPISDVFFPETGLLSIISDLLSGVSVETSIVGRDGALGFIEAVGSRHIYSRVVVQIPGEAWLVSAGAYRGAFEASAELRTVVGCVVELQLAELRQSAICLANHEVRPRLARWLLECHDRSGRPVEMPLTQEFMAAMIGAGRPVVSTAAGDLQDEGLIAYTRGAVRLLDRQRLESTACECRKVILTLRRRILPESERMFPEPGAEVGPAKQP